jgi:hypothetical protein
MWRWMCAVVNGLSLLTGLIVIKCLHVTVDWCFCKPWDMRLMSAIPWDTLHLLMIVGMTSLYADDSTLLHEWNKSLLACWYISDVCFWKVWNSDGGDCVGRNGSVGIATCYGLDGAGWFESLYRRIFRSPDRPWGLPSILCSGYRVSFPGVKRLGVWC